MSTVEWRAVATVAGPSPKSNDTGAAAEVDGAPAGAALPVVLCPSEPPPHPARARPSTVPAATTAARDPGLLAICPTPRMTRATRGSGRRWTSAPGRPLRTSSAGERGLGLHGGRGAGLTGGRGHRRLAG